MSDKRHQKEELIPLVLSVLFNYLMQLPNKRSIHLALYESPHSLSDHSTYKRRNMLTRTAEL